MFDGITVGKYCPEDSFIHHMDPRVKSVLSLALMVIVFCASNVWSLVACGVFIVALCGIAHISPVKAVTSLGPLLILVVLAVVLNVLFEQGGTVYVQWGVLCISEGGIRQAVFLGFRLLLLLMAMNLLTLTTTTLDITTAFEHLIKPLRVFHVPAHELGMILGLTLRFLPQFMTELQTIYKAQVSRGAQLFKNPLKAGISGLTSLLVPLFSSVFRHSDQLAAAMDARCYHGSVGCTRLNPLRMTWRDGVAIAVIAAFFACVLAMANVG